MGALRLLLALSVIATHTSAIRWLALPTGTAAVQIFFVISGFYMALILNEKYRGPGSYRLFIVNRFARIYPVYFLVAGVSLLIVLGGHTEVKLLEPERLNELGVAAKTMIFGSNLAIFGLDSLSFLAIENGGLVVVRDIAEHPLVTDHMALVPQAWSLSPELLFYLLAPLVVRRVFWISILGLLSVGLRAVLWQRGFHSHAWTFDFFPAELASFLLGALLYHAMRTRLFRRWGPMLATFAPFATGLGLFNYTELPGLLAYGLAVASIPFLFELTRRNALDRFVGELSYPLYMVHYIPIYLAQSLAPELAQSGRFSSICVASSLLLSLAIYRWVILPIDRWRERSTRRMLPPFDALQPIAPSVAFPMSPAGPVKVLKAG
jgi:peptidoglycan/LPS O-acetylase OafA/YrhL